MKPRDISFMLCAFAYICLAWAYMLIDRYPVTEFAEKFSGTMSNYHRVYLEHTSFWVGMYNIDVSYDIFISHIEEEPGDEFNCLFYACEPIGRYYITAYNHLETGGKITASGTTCHEGTVSTCAADPRYHKFGDILEVDGRLYVVEDTGSAVKKKHIDLYFASYKDMAKYGSNYQTIYKVTFPFGRPKYD